MASSGRFTITKRRDGSVTINMSGGDFREVISAVFTAATYYTIKPNRSRRVVTTAKFLTDLANNLYDAGVDRNVIGVEMISEEVG